MFPLEDVSIVKSTTPVRRPTTRGDVYFSDTSAYKIRATTYDLSLVSLLPKVMLGPNTEFKPLEIKTKITNHGKEVPVTLITHLTNTMNNKTRLELNLVIDQIESD
ncbi:MAG: hypothetical protein HY295_01450 [Thaumarchaeota archaeon]|nr:hypothetical protein [Nitrososphaerota archaeon]